MPGALPSGSNQSYITPFPFSIIGSGFSALFGRNETNVRATLTEEVMNMDATKGQSDQVFSGLDASLGLPGGIIKFVLQTIAGVPLSIVGGIGGLFGFGGVPASQITPDATANLVPNAQFNVDLTGWDQRQGVWTRDLAQGNTNPGSARVVANGTTKELVGTKIMVTEENNLTVGCQVRYEDAVGSVTPIRLHLELLDAGGIVLSTQVISGTAADGDSDDWIELQDVFDVPATVKFVRPVLVITNNMTAGTVWWDDVLLIKAGLMPQSTVNHLPNNLLNLASIFGLTSLLPLNIDPEDFDPTGLVSIIDAFVPGVGSLVDNIFNGFTGLFGTSDHTQEDAADAIAGQADSTAGTASLVEQLRAALSPGNVDADAFERTGALTTPWSVFSTGSGSTTMDGHNLVIVGSALSTYEVVCRKDDVLAFGDAPEGSIVLDSVPASFLGPQGHNDIWFRMPTTGFTSFATRTGGRFRYSGGGGWSLSWFNSGVETVITSGTVPTKAVAGSVLTLRVDKVNPHKYYATVHGTPLPGLDGFVDAGSTMTIASTHRKRGVGGKVESFFANFDPGKLRQFTAAG